MERYLKDGFARINCLEEEKVEDGLLQLQTLSTLNKLRQIPLGNYRRTSYFLDIDVFALPFDDEDFKSDPSPRKTEHDVLADYLHLIRPFRASHPLPGPDKIDCFQLGKVFFGSPEAKRYTNFALVVTREKELQPWLIFKFQDNSEDGSEYEEDDATTLETGNHQFSCAKMVYNPQTAWPSAIFSMANMDNKIDYEVQFDLIEAV